MCEKTTASRCVAAAGRENSRELRGWEQRALSLPLERLCAACVVALESEEPVKVFYKKGKAFAEDLLGHGGRKAEVLLFCFWRMLSSFLIPVPPLAKPEPGMRAS